MSDKYEGLPPLGDFRSESCAFDEDSTDLPASTVLEIKRRLRRERQYLSLLQERDQLSKDFIDFLELAEHKLDQRLQGQYTEKQICGMLLKLSRELLLKHKTQEHDQVLARETPEQAWKKGWDLGYRMAQYDIAAKNDRRDVPPYSAPKETR